MNHRVTLQPEHREPVIHSDEEKKPQAFLNTVILVKTYSCWSLIFFDLEYEIF